MDSLSERTVKGIQHILMHDVRMDHLSDFKIRKEVYRKIYMHLKRSGIKGFTFVYPEALKKMVRDAYPGEVANYVAPAGRGVRQITIKELNLVYWASCAKCR